MYWLLFVQKLHDIYDKFKITIFYTIIAIIGRREESIIRIYLHVKILFEKC